MKRIIRERKRVKSNLRTALKTYFHFKFQFLTVWIPEAHFIVKNESELSLLGNLIFRYFISVTLPLNIIVSGLGSGG
jgi:hypothetical protein